MKVGIVSDTHVPTAAPALPPSLVQAFAGVDLILHAGDLIELSVLDDLRRIAPVHAVAGNVDGPEVLALLPRKRVLPLGRFSVGLIHGQYRIDRQHDLIRRQFERVDLIVYGHSHRPFWGRVGDVLMLNPGSPTDNRHAPYHSAAILTVGDTLSAEIVRLEPLLRTA